MHCKFPEKIRTQHFPKLICHRSLFIHAAKSYRPSVPRDALKQLSVHMKMTKMNELEAPLRAPTGTPWATGQHPSIYCRFCCQVVVPTGPSLPASPALLGPTCPQGSSCQPACPPGPEQQGTQPPQVPCLNSVEMLAPESALQ